MADKKQLGLAVVGCGVVGRIRGALAKDFPGIGWIGLADTNEALGLKLKDDIGADFFTTSFQELIARPEVDAVIHLGIGIQAAQAGATAAVVAASVATTAASSG